MASLGQVCAVGIACNMLLSVFVLPHWWGAIQRLRGGPREITTPSSLYGPRLWQLGLVIARLLPPAVCNPLARFAALVYWHSAPRRRQVVMQNLLPALNGDAGAAVRTARRLFSNFALKVVDLWRMEAGVAVNQRPGDWKGLDVFTKAHGKRRGVLLVTPHLGNWELGGAFLAQQGYELLVLTQSEPQRRLTELRQASRARRGVQTLVIGGDAFAFVEIIKRLQAGAAVALLVDRPPAQTGVTIELFGRPFEASIAPAELARASGCAIVLACVTRSGNGYQAELLPEMPYDRARLGDRAARTALTQQIMRAFEPHIREHLDQWYHFVPVWR
jgi:KDO2-lipid IV(A) lauroyltransferase